MDISVNKDTDFSVFSITGRVDTMTAPELEKRITEWIDEGGARLVIDMDGVDYISSAGLRTVLSTAKKIKAKSGKFCLIRLKPTVLEVFKIAGFDAIIPIFGDLEDAKKIM
jgi:anti-anti-sigma factor